MIELLENSGKNSLAFFKTIGGMFYLVIFTVYSVIIPRFSLQNLIKSIYKYGFKHLVFFSIISIGLGLVLGFGAAAAMKIVYLSSMVGWAIGYFVLREIGPITFGIIFIIVVLPQTILSISSELKKNNSLTKEVVTLRKYIVPSILGLLFSILSLTLIGNLLIIFSASFAGNMSGQISNAGFWVSFKMNIQTVDFVHGMIKATGFGVTTAIIAGYFALNLYDNSDNKGKIISNATTLAFVMVLGWDFLVTFLVL